VIQSAAIPQTRGIQAQPFTTRVLLIEDDPEYTRVVQRSLSGSNYARFEVLHTDRLSTGLKLLSGGGIAVVLMDLGLPDSQGLETFRKVYAHAPEIAIVVLSGQDDQDLAVRAVDEGAQDYLVKRRVDGEVIQRALRYAVSRKRAEEQLRRSEEKLLHAQKMEGLGRLAGGIAHDFNNLLTSILGFGRLILSQIDEGHPVRPDVEEIVRSGERATALTKQLLTFSRRSNSSVCVLDVDRVVMAMEQLLRRTIGSDIELRIEPSGDRACIKGDESRIEQVLLNLVINSRDAMPRGGTLVIHTSGVTVDDAFCRTRSGIEPGDYVKLSVADTGCGISKDILPLVFEPFFTTKEAGKGTGLGLCTVYGITKQFGGYIELHTEVDKGTRVDLYFPRVEATPEVVERRKTLVRGGSETILLVEDEESLRRLGRRLLEALGYNVIEAEDGAKAVEVFAAAREQVDLLLTDVIMPKMGGPELVQHLRAKNADLKVLYMSGFVGSAIGTELVGADDAPIIHKPYTREDLARMVRQVLDNDADVPQARL
jgi:signal transduction histidine kinase